MSVLSVESVCVNFIRKGVGVAALSDVSLSVKKGEIVALIGESGSGKSTLARAIVGLLPVASGQIHIDGQPLPRRGRRPVAMVFQDPLGSLDPRFTGARAIREILRVHNLVERADEGDRMLELLDLVGLPADLVDSRPRYLSGGQQQRLAIARALASEPAFLILDEALSALDASVRAQVLRMLADLRTRLDIGMLFIGHDLALVRQLADRVAVLKNGVLVEVASADEFFAAPAHPYSRELLDAVPTLRGR